MHNFALLASCFCCVFFSSKIKLEPLQYNCYLYGNNSIYDYEVFPLPNIYAPQIFNFLKVEFALGFHPIAVAYPLCSQPHVRSRCVPIPLEASEQTASDTSFWLGGGRQEPWLLALLGLDFKQLPISLLFFSLSQLVYLLIQDFTFKKRCMVLSEPVFSVLCSHGGNKSHW